jgi:hypothetical protein
MPAGVIPLPPPMLAPVIKTSTTPIDVSKLFNAIKSGKALTSVSERVIKELKKPLTFLEEIAMGKQLKSIKSQNAADDKKEQKVDDNAGAVNLVGAIPLLDVA